LENFIKKYEVYTWVDLKVGLKVLIENFWGTNIGRNFFEDVLKTKLWTFIGTRNIFITKLNVMNSVE
jgi:hypothetical protein